MAQSTAKLGLTIRDVVIAGFNDLIRLNIFTDFRIIVFY